MAETTTEAAAAVSTKPERGGQARVGGRDGRLEMDDLHDDEKLRGKSCRRWIGMLTEERISDPVARNPFTYFEWVRRPPS